jgi:NDP-sugar pyrophosphorylase family protein
VVEPGARLEGPCALLAGARVAAGARVGPNTVVDRGATVAGDADLENVLVFPGVTARGHLRDRVILPG